MGVGGLNLYDRRGPYRIGWHTRIFFPQRHVLIQSDEIKEIKKRMRVVGYAKACPAAAHKLGIYFLSAQRRAIGLGKSAAKFRVGGGVLRRPARD